MRSIARSRSPPARSSPIARPDLTNTSPVVDIGPFPQWSEPGRIVSLDPWGHRIAEDFRQEIGEGVDIRPSIAITKARLTISELDEAVVAGRLKVDGTIMKDTGDVAVTKAAVEPVWYLPGHRGALRRRAKTRCAARCSSRPAACTRSW